MIVSPRPLAIMMSLLSLILAGCMLMPGKFVSELDLGRDGRFSFTYAGEIHMLALSKLAQMGKKESTGEMVEEPCTTEEGKTRPCTSSEIADQRERWQEGQRATEASRRKETEQMKAFLGGIDPADPKAAEELAARLRRQAGWKRVDYRGDGLFDIDFAISGRLDHDFAFPTIERMAMINPFIQIALRNDGTVRIDAPGYGPAHGAQPWQNMMQAAALASEERNAPRFPLIDGRFTLRTDGTILANNTEDGPQAATTGQVLTWTISPRSQAAPMALVQMH